jgi:hypothetical protein
MIKKMTLFVSVFSAVSAGLGVLVTLMMLGLGNLNAQTTVANEGSGGVSITIQTTPPISTPTSMPAPPDNIFSTEGTPPGYPVNTEPTRTMTQVAP